MKRFALAHYLLRQVHQCGYFQRSGPRAGSIAHLRFKSKGSHPPVSNIAQALDGRKIRRGAALRG
jgi:hypothetical protein